MIFSLKCKVEELREPTETAAAPHVLRLEKFLKSYPDDALLLHGVMNREGHPEEYDLSLTLTIPSDTLHAVGRGTNVPVSVKAAFVEIETQLKKHKEHERHDHEWRRKVSERAAEEV